MLGRQRIEQPWAWILGGLAVLGHVAACQPHLNSVKPVSDELPPPQPFLTPQVPWEKARRPQWQIVSGSGVDYTALQTMLKRRQWRQADQETFQIMLRVANRQQQGWLRQQDVMEFACEDLLTLAHLWEVHSHHHFGFNRQQLIWEQVGGKPGQYLSTWSDAFGQEVGWRQRGQWLTYSQLTFRSGAPAGHFPATTGNGISGGVWGGIASISARLDLCRIEIPLKQQDWITADWATHNAMLAIAGRVDGKISPGALPRDAGDLGAAELRWFYCPSLQAIDRLWQHYSRGRQGFSVQAQIYQQTGNQAGRLNWRAYERFGDRIGWRQSGSWIFHQQHHYEGAPATAIPRGHFPYRIGWSTSSHGSSFTREWRAFLNPECFRAPGG